MQTLTTVHNILYKGYYYGIPIIIQTLFCCHNVMLMLVFKYCYVTRNCIVYVNKYVRSFIMHCKMDIGNFSFPKMFAVLNQNNLYKLYIVFVESLKCLAK